jgi:hypothetical protein
MRYKVGWFLPFPCYSAAFIVVVVAVEAFGIEDLQMV